MKTGDYSCMKAWAAGGSDGKDRIVAKEGVIELNPEIIGTISNRNPKVDPFGSIFLVKWMGIELRIANATATGEYYNQQQTSECCNRDLPEDRKCHYANVKLGLSQMRISCFQSRMSFATATF